MKFQKVKAFLLTASVAASAIAGTVYSAAETKSIFNNNTAVYEAGTTPISINGRSYKGLTDREQLDELLPSFYDNADTISYSAFVDGQYIYYIINGSKYSPDTSNPDYLSGTQLGVVLRGHTQDDSLSLAYSFLDASPKYFTEAGAMKTLNVANGYLYFSTYGNMYFNERDITKYTDVIQNPEWYNSKDVAGMDGKGELYAELRVSLNALQPDATIIPELVRTSIVYNTHEPKYYIFNSSYKDDIKGKLVDETNPEDYDEFAGLEDEDEDDDIEGPVADDVLDSEDEPEPEIEDSEFIEDTTSEDDDDLELVEDIIEEEEIDDNDLLEDDDLFDDDMEDDIFDDDDLSEVDDEDASADEDNADDVNPRTGVAVAFTPAIIAAAALIVSRKRK